MKRVRGGKNQRARRVKRTQMRGTDMKQLRYERKRGNTSYADYPDPEPFWTIYLTPAGQAEVDDIFDELEKTLGVEIGVVYGHGVNVHTKHEETVREAAAIIGKDRIVEVAPPLRGYAKKRGRK